MIAVMLLYTCKSSVSRNCSLATLINFYICSLALTTTESGGLINGFVVLCPGAPQGSTGSGSGLI